MTRWGICFHEAAKFSGHYLQFCSLHCAALTNWLTSLANEMAPWKPECVLLFIPSHAMVVTLLAQPLISHIRVPNLVLLEHDSTNILELCILFFFIVPWILQHLLHKPEFVSFVSLLMQIFTLQAASIEIIGRGAFNYWIRM